MGTPFRSGRAAAPLRPKPAFQPGFRWSLADGIVLAVGALAALGLYPVYPACGVVVAFVVGHFFYFCNLIRMARRLELLWAGQFVLLSSSALWAGVPTGPQALALSCAFTVALTVFQLRKPSYHGIFWRRLNPGLREWWERHGEQVR